MGINCCRAAVSCFRFVLLAFSRNRNNSTCGRLRERFVAVASYLQLVLAWLLARLDNAKCVWSVAHKKVAKVFNNNSFQSNGVCFRVSQLEKLKYICMCVHKSNKYSKCRIL